MGQIIRFFDRSTVVNIIIILLITSIVATGFLLMQITIVKAFMLTLFGSLTAISFYKLFQLVTKDRDSFGMESALPGIDGSITGWRLTPSLTMLIITSVFAIATVAAATI